MKQNGSNDDTWWVEPVDPLTFYSIDSSAWAYRYGIAEVPLSYFSISDLTLSEGDTSSITISRTGGSNSSQSIVITQVLLQLQWLRLYSCKSNNFCRR